MGLKVTIHNDPRLNVTQMPESEAYDVTDSELYLGRVGDGERGGYNEAMFFELILPLSSPRRLCTRCRRDAFGLTIIYVGVFKLIGRPEVFFKNEDYKRIQRQLGPLQTDYNMSTVTETKKLILVIGATGAQGIAVIDGLLAPSADGSPSPYAVRALTRDPSSRRAVELSRKGVECVEGEHLHPSLIHKRANGSSLRV